MARRRDSSQNKDRASGARTQISWLLATAAILFVLSRFYILFALEPQNTDVENTYFAYAIRAHDAHFPPYTNALPVEYPPLAWWLIYAPRTFDAHYITDQSQLKPALDSYTVIFRGVMFFCDLGSAALFLLIVKRRNPALLGWAALTYTIATATLCHLLYDRLDTALWLMLLGWAYCWLRSWEKEGRTLAWSTAAYTILGLSISFKLIPVLAVPFIVLADWRAPQRSKRLIYGLTTLFLAIGLPFLIQYAISGDGVFALLKYHGERGIQIESLYSTLMMISALFAGQIYVTKSHSAFDLEGSLAKLMTALSSVLMFCFLAGTWLWALFRRAKYRGVEAYRLVCYILAGAVIFSKVLSPQYFLWAIPLAILLAVDILPSVNLKAWALSAIIISVAGLTTWLFPYHYANFPGHPGLLPIDSDPSVLLPAPCIVLGARNLLYLGIIIWLGWLLLRGSGEKPQSEIRK